MPGVPAYTPPNVFPLDDLPLRSVALTRLPAGRILTPFVPRFGNRLAGRSSMTRSRIAVLVLIAAALGFQPAGVLVAQQPQAPPAFRANVVLVPVDVRVVDGDGNPVTDLKAADFTVFENGVRQQIAHFSTQAYFEGAPPAQTPRTFFFLLGRGRLNETTKALDALIEFVRSRLLPEDRVGVLAYLHLVEPTTDHTAVVRLLERYRARHEGIEDKLTRDRQARARRALVGARPTLNWQLRHSLTRRDCLRPAFAGRCRGRGSHSTT
jgi:hypothetical protein